jgi:flagellar biosynthesis GTPase FlhF
MKAQMSPFLSKRTGVGGVVICVLCWLAVPAAQAEKPGWLDRIKGKKATEEVKPGKAVETAQADAAKASDDATKAAKKAKDQADESAKTAKAESDRAQKKAKDKAEKAKKAGEDIADKQQDAAKDAAEKAKEKLKADKDRTTADMKELGKGSEQGQAAREEHRRKWWKFGAD